MNPVSNLPQPSGSIPAMDTTVSLPRLMDQKELCAYVGKSVKWAERARWAGEGPRFIRLGRHVRYRADDVLAWIDECSRRSTSDGAGA